MKKHIHVFAVILAVAALYGCSSAPVAKISGVENIAKSENLVKKISVNQDDEKNFEVNYSFEESNEMLKDKVYIRKGDVKIGDKIVSKEENRYDKEWRLISEKSLDAKNVVMLEKTYAYNIKGEIEKEVLSDGKTSIETTYLTEKNNKKVSKKSFNEKKALEWEDEYTYFPNGMIAGEVYKDSQGKVKYGYGYEYEYDSNGNVLKMVMKGQDGSTAVTTYKYEMVISGFSEKPAFVEEYANGEEFKSRTEYLYNEVGNLKAKIKYDEYEVQQMRERFYDNGKVTEKYWLGEQDNVCFWEEYIYDAGGRLLEEKILNESGEVVSRVVYQYNTGIKEAK